MKCLYLQFRNISYSLIINGIFCYPLFYKFSILPISLFKSALFTGREDLFRIFKNVRKRSLPNFKKITMSYMMSHAMLHTSNKKKHMEKIYIYTLDISNFHCVILGKIQKIKFQFLLIIIYNTPLTDHQIKKKT